jgi:hypothetical protein
MENIINALNVDIPKPVKARYANADKKTAPPLIVLLR